MRAACAISAHLALLFKNTRPDELDSRGVTTLLTSQVWSASTLSSEIEACNPNRQESPSPRTSPHLPTSPLTSQVFIAHNYSWDVEDEALSSPPRRKLGRASADATADSLGVPQVT